MSATRSRKEEKNYKRYIKKVDKSQCIFCGIDKNNKSLIKQTPSFKIVRNIFAYSLWDGQAVVDHLMVVPIKHTETLKDFTAEEALELLKLLSLYENQGYNVYARAPSSHIKSIPHQHTHLIKTEGRPKKFIFLTRKPYIRIIL